MARAIGLVLSVVLLGTAFGCKKDDDGLDGPGLAVSVFTHNLYLGSDLTALVTIPSPAQVPAVGATLWANVQASDFPSRAKVLAAEIVALAPDLVALQEVTTYRRQTPSDYQPGDAVPNASEVVIDFLATLMAEIGALGGGYHVAGEALNADVELPVSDGQGGLFDIRLTDSDVILARDAVLTSNFVAMPFVSKFEFTAGFSGGVPVSITRSASRLDADVGGARFTFANTHLEVRSLEGIQVLQAGELLDWMAPVPDPVLMLGDFNTEPGALSYPLLVGQFKDAYTQAGGPDPGGFTCCQADNLMNPEFTGSDRIDLVLYRGRFRVNDVTVTGADPATGRTPAGLWPSDHLGVLSHAELVP